MRAQKHQWAAKESCPYNWRRLWEACALAQVAVESTHWQAQISVVSSVSGDIWLLLRRKPLLGATPRSAKGAGISRGFQPQANFSRPGEGAYGRKINQVH